MTRRAAVKWALVSVTALGTGWGLEWAYYAIGPTWFCIGIASAAVLALCVWLVVRLVPLIPGDGKHADKRGEETAPPWAGERPAGIAHEPAMPPEMLAAPVAAPPGVYLPEPVKVPSLVLDHDEDGPDQTWDDDEESEPAPGSFCLSQAAVVVAVTATLAALRGPVEAAIAAGTARAQAEAQRQRDETQPLRDKIQRLEDEARWPGMRPGPFCYAAETSSFRDWERDSFVGRLPVLTPDALAQMDTEAGAR